MDPYTTKASATSASTKEKIDGLNEIIKSVQTAMFTTRSQDGHLHARAMSPASSQEGQELKYIFLANNASHKFDEIKNDDNANVAFLNPSTTAWASIAGKARIDNDRERIKKYWSTTTAAWFGDLGDGVHKGDANDPRVSLIEVLPDEIHYWYPANKLKQAVEVGVGTVTGKVASPGELRVLSKDEIKGHAGN